MLLGSVWTATLIKKLSLTYGFVLVVATFLLLSLTVSRLFFWIKSSLLLLLLLFLVLVLLLFLLIILVLSSSVGRVSIFYLLFGVSLTTSRWFALFVSFSLFFWFDSLIFFICIFWEAKGWFHGSILRVKPETVRIFCFI